LESICMQYIMVGSQLSRKQPTVIIRLSSICSSRFVPITAMYTVLVTHNTPTLKTCFVMKPLSCGGAEGLGEEGRCFARHVGLDINDKSKDQTTRFGRM